ncbi:uncharacterized protein [Oscarella lobularis]|uniref:uncharacterized protein isoform X2 n=1 Tax=Oscarella lobularis TaxID=121494 RepID=UPI003313BED3
MNALQRRSTTFRNKLVSKEKRGKQAIFCIQGDPGPKGESGQKGTKGDTGAPGVSGQGANETVLHNLVSRFEMLEKIVESEPPQWLNESFLGTYAVTSSSKISWRIAAEDPFGYSVSYTMLKCNCNFPPNFMMNKTTGVITGELTSNLVPKNSNGVRGTATFNFMVIAISEHGKATVKEFVFNVTGYPSPDYDSGWIKFTSQAGSDSFKILSHNFGTFPRRVATFVRATDGANKGYVFNGVGAAPGDDEKDNYGGVVFAYNETIIKLWAPDVSNWKIGHIIMTGDGWGGEKNAQFSHNAEIKVMAWINYPDGEPNYAVDWFEMKSNDGSNSFKELQLPSQSFRDYPSQCRVLTKAVDGNNIGFIFEGIGAPTGYDIIKYFSYGGLVFAYNSSDVRLWAPTKNKVSTDGRIVFVTDGWGGPEGEKNGQASHTANVTVQAWSADNERVLKPAWESSWFTMSSQSGVASFTELNHNLGTLPLKVTVLSRALVPNNAGFIFEGVGAATGEDEAADYGGVLYAFNENSVRIWVPDRNDGRSGGRIFALYNGWGNEINSQQRQSSKDSGEIKVQVWI